MNYENSTLSLGMFPPKQVMSKNYQHYLKPKLTFTKQLVKEKWFGFV